MKLWLPIATVVVISAAGCSDVDRKWMKLSGNYTTEELRRDISACTRDRVLNDRCMEDRGWVVMNPSREDSRPIRNPDLDRSPKGIRY